MCGVEVVTNSVDARSEQILNNAPTNFSYPNTKAVNSLANDSPEKLAYNIKAFLLSLILPHHKINGKGTANPKPLHKGLSTFLKVFRRMKKSWNN